jgi:4-methylaminobutanoate oxidase (formaldehyde-forming)
MVVTAAATSVRDWHYLKDTIRPGARVELADITTTYGTLGVMGPRSRELLEKLTDADLSNQGFPFATAKEIVVGPAEVLAQRISYVGELGWELYIPAEFARGVLKLVLEAGAEFGVHPTGMHAMDSMRIEKAFRHWGHDIGTHDSILEAGLGFTCDFSKDFIGKAAVEKQKSANLLKRRMVQFAMEDPALLLYHNEPIYRDGKHVGLVTSANYGHTLNAAIGMGYVTNEAGIDADFVKTGKFEIAIAGTRHAARASLRPMADPSGARMKV